MFRAAPEAFVFRTKHEEHINIKNWYNRIWVKAVAGSGLEIPGLTIHSLRHTFASLSIAAGADVKTVQNALGHADASITLNVYTSLWPDHLDEVAEIMEQQRDRQLN
ncbi:tyrosine-type recombinase/integrase [Bifidobacterium asteroides]|uniref:tyrosine-type recombinase/integrase n=1 Tax=Bifidobacterium asteroides TaxID=1684 RepID=UPI001C69D488|nr:tyrosine-type recombinase/integrase [Bifidobacterium asteroides]QYN60618.1 tyrosine-type recombinase/integrase [Bifidobacterium asteroides]